MGQAAGQKAGDKYRKRLIGHFPDSDNTMQVCQDRAKETKADYLRTHCRAGSNDISSKAYCERRYDRFGSVTVNSKKNQKD